MSLLADLGTTGPRLIAVAVSTVGIYVAVVVLTRATGPRSLAAMSSFDFAATVAIGSTLATTAVGSPSLADGAAALVLLFGAQALVAQLRRRTAFAAAVDNQPLLLMSGPVVHEANLRQARISREELFGQLRSAGVQQLTDVRAVVLETNGKVSVLTGGPTIDDELLVGVRGAELLR